MPRARRTTATTGTTTKIMKSSFGYTKNRLIPSDKKQIRLLRKADLFCFFLFFYFDTFILFYDFYFFSDFFIILLDAPCNS